MAKDDLKPTTIDEIPFPSSTQTVKSPTGGTSSETYNATQIATKSFPILNIATGLRSTSLNTETRTIGSNFTFQQFGAISIGTVKGTGTALTGTGIRISPYGIYGYAAGVSTFTLNAITGAFVTSGYIQVGGAAADVNAGVTLVAPGKVLISGATTLSAWSSGSDATYIDGGKIYTGSINADRIMAASTLTVGSGNNVGIMSGTDGTYRIWAGHATAGSAPFRVTQAGALTASSVTISGALTSQSGSHLDVGYVDAGTLTVGSGGATAITIKHTASKANAIVKWEGGSSIWEDSNNYLGLWAYGGQMFFWSSGANNARLTLTPHGGQNIVYGGIQIYKDQSGSGNLNVEGDTHLNGYLLLDDDHLTLGGASPRDFSVRNEGLTSWHDTSGGRDRSVLTWGSGTEFGVDRTGSWFHVNGNDKSAIVPTSQGYRSLYCAESPEVWFFDFCESDKKIDPIFLEVTEGEMRFIKCDKGFQVWRRRKGHAHKRFEPKTAFQFYKNEKFLQMAK